MDYKEKYKEALERASKLRVQNPFDTVGQMVEHIFPELKESEDERIRNGIIALLKFGLEDGSAIAPGFNVTKEQAIAWLEKQGFELQYWKPSEEQLEALDYAYNSCPDTERGNYYEGVLETLIDDLYKLSEKQGEQPTDKVESKFKVGDWVIDNFGNIYQIETATEIESEHIFGYTIVGGGYFNDNSNVRLWTINDAKDGDVLYSIDSKQPFIYKERPQFSQARGYCCINKFGEFAVWNTSKCVICTDKYIPATKEQRDLLFQKMKKAGYDWDSKKKELKKIESNTLDADEVIEWLKTKVYDDSTYAMVMIEQFKKDFGL